MDVSVGGTPTSAAAAANEFLELGWRESGVPPIDQMKLQKLLFYGHAWYLAQTGQPVFGEDFEAWPWGPVVRDVYFQTREYGRSPVSKPITQLSGKSSNGSLKVEFIAPRIENESIKKYIKSVWETHKIFSGTQLSNATHLPGEPWTIVKDKYGNLDSKPTIPNDLIAAVFRQKIANGTSSAATAQQST